MWTSLLVVALLAAGCFSTGSSPTQDTVNLVSDSTLAADGPDVQTVSVRAVERDGRLVYIDQLHVWADRGRRRCRCGTRRGGGILRRRR